MNRATRLAFAALAASTVESASHPSRADAPNAKATPLYVLPISTDDADDQAEALTEALRARVRQTPGWSLLESAQSFETLSIALRCPPKPDAACLERIADQLHADRYVWGTMTRKKGPGEVTADLHLWSREEADRDASESYGDNLKNENEDSLRAVALRLFSKLRGVGAAGTLVVLAGKGGGIVLVDGANRGALDNGLARVNVTPGSHVVAVNIAGFETAQQTAEVVEGSEKDVTFRLVAAQGKPVVNPSQDEGPPPSSLSLGRALGYATLVVGAGALVASGVEAAEWANDAQTSKTDRQSIPKSVNDVCASSASIAQDACSKSKDAVTVSTLGWVLGGAGVALVGTGIWLLVSTGTPTSTPRSMRTEPRPEGGFQVLPAVGPGMGGIDVRVRF